jgi:hypothetical protein
LRWDGQFSLTAFGIFSNTESGWIDMNKKLMNWVWDHPLTVTVIISMPTFVVVTLILLYTHII